MASLLKGYVKDAAHSAATNAASTMSASASGLVTRKGCSCTCPLPQTGGRQRAGGKKLKLAKGPSQKSKALGMTKSFAKLAAATPVGQAAKQAAIMQAQQAAQIAAQQAAAKAVQVAPMATQMAVPILQQAVQNQGMVPPQQFQAAAQFQVPQQFQAAQVAAQAQQQAVQQFQAAQAQAQQQAAQQFQAAAQVPQQFQESVQVAQQFQAPVQAPQQTVQQFQAPQVVQPVQAVQAVQTPQQAQIQQVPQHVQLSEQIPQQVPTASYTGCSCTCPTIEQVGGAKAAVESLSVKELKQAAHKMKIPNRSRLRTREQLAGAILSYF